MAAAVTIAVVSPVRARLEQAGDRQAGIEQAQAAAALQQMQTATAKQAEAVIGLQQKQAQEAAARQAQEEAARQAQALALEQAQAQAAALQQAQAQAAAQQQAVAASLQQKQAQEAAARQAQIAAQRQAQASAQQAIHPAGDVLSPIERSILNTLNADRVVAGLAPLQLDPTLVATARAHSAQMSAGNRLFHTTDLAAGAPPKWRTLGENVAMSTSLNALNARLMQSPTHRGNILGDFDRVGIGVVVAGGRIWATQEFMQAA
ncbi:MAG TPA: CAP domain-containing protein [Actinomycetota bacterium]|jgi:uncharacterized protein YkwD